MKNILFLCTGNSCRSIMAEGLMRHYGNGKFNSFSAGSNPTGKIHPISLSTLKSKSINSEGFYSKSWNKLEKINIDIVITVCDNAASESCPVFLGKAEKLHWSIPDPAKASGTEEEIKAEFERVFEMLKGRIETLLQEQKPNNNKHFENLKNYMSENRTILQADYTEGEGFYISKKLNPVNFAKSYIISADYLIEASRDDEMEPIILWPVLYLFRHAIELFIKQAIHSLGNKCVGHDITLLYSRMESEVIAFENQNNNFMIHESLLPDEDAFFSIMQFHSISPLSTELRYEDSGLIGGSSHLLVGNFVNAQFHAKRASYYFDWLENQIKSIEISKND